MQRVLTDPKQRQPGTFSGFAPPDLGAVQFVQGEAATLRSLRERPVMLVFWSPRQDAIIPSTSWLRHTLERTETRGLQVVIVCDAATTRAAATAYLAEHPLPGARVAVEPAGTTYDRYFVKEGFFGMPRVLLIDADGKVVFEGDPGLKQGKEWQPSDGPTYVDQALDKLLAR